MSVTTRRRASAYSLRRRLMVAMVAGFGAILSVVSVGLWSYTLDAANRTYDLLLDGAAIAILERITMSPDGVLIDFPPAALEMLGLAENDRVFYRIFTRAGETLTGDPGLPLPRGAGDGQASRFFDDTHSGERVRFVLRGRSVPGPAAPQWINVQIGQTRAARNAVQVDLFTKGLLGLSALALIGIVFVRIGINLAMRPLAGIEADILHREPSDLAPLRAAPPREVESLIDAINTFMQRLAASKDHAQTFIADVAHQIRTSLSALAGQLELAAEQTDPAAARARIAKASEQASRTVRLTNQLLSHAMVIHRADNQPRESVALVPLVTAVIEEAVRGAGDAALEFEVDLGDAKAADMVVRGDSVSLREALRNLIDNAGKHGQGGAIVRIVLTRLDHAGRSAISVAVEDNGPGIVAAERENVVKRFYTLAGRNGSGLGLAIVKAVAEGHGGQLRLGDARDGGLRAELVLPVDGITGDAPPGGRETA